MRTKKEIQVKILEIGAMLDGDIKQSKRENIDAVLDVLENDLDYNEIELKYFDENQTDREQNANRVREWMDGDIEELLIY